MREPTPGPVSAEPGAPDSGRRDEEVAATPDGLVGRTCAGGFGAFGAPERISTGLDSRGDLFGAALAANGLSLYFSVSLPQSEQIYVATREATGTTTFSNVREVPVVNSAALDGSPFVSTDELRIFFFSDRSGGRGGRDIWSGERAERGAAFSAPTLLPGVNTPRSELLPWLAPDELTILFLSNRPFGGDVDIWRATRVRVDAAFEAAVNVSDLNSTGNEGRTVLSSDGLSAIFSSDRAGGLGDADLWMASRPDPVAAFSAPINLTPLNSDADDLDVALSSDQRELIFSSSRSGVSALWRSLRDCR